MFEKERLRQYPFILKENEVTNFYKPKTVSNQSFFMRVSQKSLVPFLKNKK